MYFYVLLLQFFQFLNWRMGVKKKTLTWINKHRAVCGLFCWPTGFTIRLRCQTAQHCCSLDYEQSGLSQRSDSLSCGSMQCVLHKQGKKTDAVYLVAEECSSSWCGEQTCLLGWRWATQTGLGPPRWKAGSPGTWSTESFISRQG